MKRSVIFIWLKRLIIRAFCLHENWSDGDMTSPMVPFGKSEYTCLNCGKKIYRPQNDPPVSRRVINGRTGKVVNGVFIKDGG